MNYFLLGMTTEAILDTYLVDMFDVVWIGQCQQALVFLPILRCPGDPGDPGVPVNWGRLGDEVNSEGVADLLGLLRGRSESTCELLTCYIHYAVYPRHSQNIPKTFLAHLDPFGSIWQLLSLVLFRSLLPMSDGWSPCPAWRMWRFRPPICALRTCTIRRKSGGPETQKF